MSLGSVGLVVIPHRHPSRFDCNPIRAVVVCGCCGDVEGHVGELVAVPRNDQRTCCNFVGRWDNRLSRYQARFAARVPGPRSAIAASG
jgi:hypothetical protein